MDQEKTLGLALQFSSSRSIMLLILMKKTAIKLVKIVDLSTFTSRALRIRAFIRYSLVRSRKTLISLRESLISLICVTR